LIAPRTGSGIVEPKLVQIPGGWFLMGHDGGQDVERPVHRVWVDAFALAATQVTNAEYAVYLRASETPAPPFWNKPGFDDPAHPVAGLSWFEAVAYCQWLSAGTGRSYRLPTEAEWERAARAGIEGRLYPWGDETPERQPNYGRRWLSGPELTGQSEPNAWGLFEMCENVHEWCGDWFQADYYRVSPERNPRGPEAGTRRSSRGGSWRHHIKISRCSARSSIPPEFQYADYGVRVACDRDAPLSQG